MNITDITTQAGADKKRWRVGRGRGSGNGKTAGRGQKGDQSRSGAKHFWVKEGGQMPTFRRLPKRGFSNFNFRQEYTVVNLGDLEARFQAGATVTAEALREVGLISTLRRPIKVLGSGELTKKLVVEAARFSKSAEEKIKGAGGEARVAAKPSAGE